MFEDGLEDAIIIQVIKTAEVDFDVSPATLGELRRTGLSPARLGQPRLLPPLQPVHLDAWNVQRPPHGPGRIENLHGGNARVRPDQTGAFICSLSVPRALTVFHFDSAAVVGVHRDEMDVPSVEVTPFTFPR